MRITLNGHPEKIVADLRQAADDIVAGRHSMIAFLLEDGETTGEIEFTADAEGFGLKDDLYADEIEQ